MHLIVVLIGAVTGFVGGLFGKGGSAIATPMLAAAGIKPFAAVASPLPATIPATVIAAWAYHRAGMVDLTVLRRTVIVGVPATVAGALLSPFVGGSALVIVCDLVVAGLGIGTLVSRQKAPALIPAGAPGSVALDEHPPRHRVELVAVLVGLASGLLANAGGFLLAPLFMTVLGLPLKKALGTSLAAAAVLAVPGTIVHGALGHVDWSVAIPFGLASVPLSAAGARLALRTKAARLEVLYGVGLVVLGIGLLAIR
jgi:uncharacterized membrane protein YfcA